ncbi:hypothetical protein SLOPH_2588 [Spraguea lophii 42_110]|uniref:Spore wall protein n=1 Tax=Spraguea lophii (strain 42_110) TaxID=1358809 RepID=S7WDT9_SPRLO|nr:hypothetical protein SLOPH_2588 [Spraguea lophii 42_110]
MKNIIIFVLFFPFRFSALSETKEYFTERVELITANNSLNNLIEIMMNISYNIENDYLNGYDKDKLKTIKDNLADTATNYGPGLKSVFGSLLGIEYGAFLSNQDYKDLQEIVTFLSDKLLRKVSDCENFKFIKEELNVKNKLLGYRLLHKINYIYENIENLENNEIVEVYYNIVCSYTMIKNANRVMKIYTYIFATLISLVFATITIKNFKKK